MKPIGLKTLAAAIAALLSIDAADALPAVQLDMLGGDIRPAAINNSGQVVGSNPDGTQALVWQNGTAISLPHISANPHVGAYAQAIGINDLGVIVGRSINNLSITKPTTWLNGVATEIDAYDTTDMAINNQGKVVIGNELYDIANGSLTSLGSLVGTAINDAGTVAGYVLGQNAQAALYSGGTTTLLPQYGSDWYSGVNAINNQGMAVGFGNDGGLTHALIWENGQATKLDSFISNTPYQADAVNENAQVVGAFRDWSGYASGAFLWTAKSGMFDLNVLIDPSAGMTLLSANDINERGQIVGRAQDQNGNVQGYQLTLTESVWAGAHNGAWDDAANWELNLRPGELQQVALNSGTSMTVVGPAANTQVKSVSLGSQNLDGYTTLKLNGGSITTESGYMMVGSKGVLTGDGRINANIYSSGKIVADNLYAYNLINQSGGIVGGSGAIHANLGNDGEVRVAAGQSLLIDGDNHANTGKIEVINGELEVNGDMTNYPSTGLITGRNATLRFNDGLHNAASVVTTGGYNDISGDIVNHQGGKIVATGIGTTNIFYDDMVNDGEIKTAAGAGSIFLGTVSGNGAFSGGGQVFFEGDLRPGHSPGQMTVNGDVTFGDANTLTMEIGGYQRGSEYDAFDVTGSLTLGGALDITLWNGFSAQAGDVFTLITANSFFGDFSQIFFPELAGLSFDLLRDSNSIRLTVATASAVPLPASAWLMLSSLMGLLLSQRRGRVA